MALELYSESDESVAAPEFVTGPEVWCGRTEKWTTRGGDSGQGVGNRLRPSVGETWPMRGKQSVFEHL